MYASGLQDERWRRWRTPRPARDPQVSARVRLPSLRLGLPRSQTGSWLAPNHSAPTAASVGLS